MGRVITQERTEQIRAISRENPDALGPALGILILDNNIPVEAVARLLNVSEPTVYRWMYGVSEPRDLDKINKLKLLMTVLRKAKRGRDLPLTGGMRARVMSTLELVRLYPPVERAAH